MKMTKWVKRSLALVLLLTASYTAIYWTLSRRGYAEADQFDLAGFYYFSPENSDSWRLKNGLCVRLFSPIHALDRMLSGGRYPASEPLWGPSS
jgi:hypothetical protein